MITVKMTQIINSEVVLSDEYEMTMDEVKKVMNNKDNTESLVHITKKYSRVGKYLLPVSISKKFIDGKKIKFSFIYDNGKERSEND